MKKYIKPEIKTTTLYSEGMIAATLPVNGSTGVPGESALSKDGGLWEMDEVEE